MKPSSTEWQEAWERAQQLADDRGVENKRLRELVDRAVYPVSMALNCPAHPWHGSDEARRWLLDFVKEETG